MSSSHSGRKTIVGIAGILLTILLVTLLGINIEQLLLGWIYFPLRTIPQMTIDWPYATWYCLRPDVCRWTALHSALVHAACRQPGFRQHSRLDIAEYAGDVRHSVGLVRIGDCICWRSAPGHLAVFRSATIPIRRPFLPVNLA